MKYAGILLLFVGACEPVALPLAPGRYCHLENLVASAGKGETIELGDYWMVVNVQHRGPEVYVEFDNVMPDSQQRLMGEGQARPKRDGSVEFDFIDNWENQGTAKLTAEGVITLTSRKAAAGLWASNAVRNYGETRVTREDCVKHGFMDWHRPR